MEPCIVYQILEKDFISFIKKWKKGWTYALVLYNLKVDEVFKNGYSQMERRMCKYANMQIFLYGTQF